MKKSLSPKISELVDYLSSKEAFDIKSISDFVSSLDFTKDDLEFCSVIHSENDSYGRNVIAETPFFELMIVTWLPGDFSMIHNHGDANWGVVKILGGLTHRVFRLEEELLIQIKEEELCQGDIRLVSNELIHQMGNSTGAPVLSLHIYFNESGLGEITKNTNLYDVVNRQILTVGCGAFYDLDDAMILDRSAGLNTNVELYDQEKILLEMRRNKKRSIF